MAAFGMSTAGKAAESTMQEMPRWAWAQYQRNMDLANQANPTGPCNHFPSPSAPRWASESLIRESKVASTGRPFRFQIPTMPLKLPPRMKGST